MQNYNGQNVQYIERSARYKKIAKEVRIKVLELIYKAQGSHVGSNFSCIDLLTVLYEKTNLKKDKIIYSKGWVAATAYVFLARKGIIPQKDLESYCKVGSKYIGLLEPRVRGIEAAGGSMGYGLPFGIGFALAKKLKGEKGKIYILMSDGEQQVGTTWESAMIASHHKLNNLCVLIDYNKFQAMGKTNEILNIEPLKEKWKSFDWQVREIDGHNFKETEKALVSPLPSKTKPLVIIARTIKGKGVSFMENNNEWHYRAPEREEYEKALKELNNKKLNG